MRKIKSTTAYLKLDSDKKLFTLMLVVTVIIILDSEIGYISDFIPETISSQGGISLFIGFAMIFIVTQFFILNYVKQLNRENKDRISHLHLLQTGVSVGQYILIAIIVIVVLQILFLQEYSIIALYLTEIIIYGLWIVILAFLTKSFFSWYSYSNKDVMVLILALSMIAYVINGIAGLATSLDMLAQQKLVITSTDVAYFPEFSIEELGSQLNMIYQIAGIAAYILTWIGTVKMLYPYIKKFGKIKFFTIMGIAMGYYVANYPLFVLGYFDVGNVDAMTNILLFSAASLLSGIIFGAAFLSVARTLRKDSSLRKHMIIAAYGFLLFYVAGSARADQAAYPPFGMAGVSFTGLSCYLIYVGLYSSAVTVSQDATLRLSIRKSLTDQTKFLDSMGSAHMEQELQSTVLNIAKKHADVLNEKTGVEASMTEGDIKEYMAMVMDEIHHKS